MMFWAAQQASGSQWARARLVWAEQAPETCAREAIPVSKTLGVPDAPLNPAYDAGEPDCSKVHGQS